MPNPRPVGNRTRGGLRTPPGGRPPLPEDEQKAKINITLDRDILEWIDQQLVARRKRSQVINELLRQVKEAN